MICKNCNRKLPDDSEFCQYCGIEIEVEENENENKGKVKKHSNLRVISISIFSILLVFVTITILTGYLFFMNKYNEAIDLLEKKEYTEAYQKLEELGTFNEADVKIKESKYNRAMEMFQNNEYEEAGVLFLESDGYMDSEEMQKYCNGIQLYNKKEYDKSNKIFEALGDYKDSKSYLYYHKYEVAKYTQPTCTKDGCVEYKCAHCEDTYIKKIEHIGHNFSPATCTKPQTCKVCGAKGEKALGHTSDEYCSRCFTEKSYTGSEYRLIENIILPNGRYKITCLNYSDRYFSARFYDNEEFYFGELIASLIGVDQEIYYLDGPINNGSIEVSSYSGNWKVTIEKA